MGRRHVRRAKHVRLAAEGARHRGAGVVEGAGHCRAVPTNMSASLPRRAPPRGRGADEHVRLAAEGARATAGAQAQFIGSARPQHFFHFLPRPQGHGSLGRTRFGRTLCHVWATDFARVSPQSQFFIGSILVGLARLSVSK